MFVIVFCSISLINHYNWFNKRFPPVLDWKVAPSQYRRQQVLASLDLDHLLLLHGCVATTNKDMLKFCFCISTKSFGLLKFKTDLGYGRWERRRSWRELKAALLAGMEVGGEGEGRPARLERSEVAGGGGGDGGWAIGRRRVSGREIIKPLHSG